MVTIAEQLEQLQKDKEKLVKKLQNQDVDVTNDETFTSMIKKIDPHTITFIDYDGTILYELDLDEMTELPPLPEHDGLICEKWNWTLEELKAEDASVYVGPLYVTDDGKTRVYITLEETDLNLWLSFNVTINKITYVNWGDGSEEWTSEGLTSSFVSINHVYPSAGDYMITFYCDDSTTAKYQFTGYNATPGALLCRRQVTTQYDSNIKSTETLMPAITKVEIGKNVSFGTSAFSYATNMKTITTSTEYSSNASCFYNTYALKTFIWRAGSLPENQFVNSGLEVLATSQTFSGYNNNISNNTTMFGKKLKQCYLPKAAKIIPSFSNTRVILNGLPKNTTLLYPTKAADYFDTLPDTITGFVGAAMAGFKGRVCNIPSGLYSQWGGKTFANNNYIEEVIYPDTIRIYSNVFSPSSTFNACANLKRVLYPTNISKVGAYDCENCTSLEEVRIPNNATEILTSAFKKCTSLKTIDLSNSLVTKIGTSCFDGCTSLSDVKLPNTLETIDTYAFRDCPLNITIPSSVTNLGSSVFYNCTKLTGPIDLSNLTTLGTYCFWNCTSLTGVTLPTGITTIPQSCFFECELLSYVYFPPNITTINDGAFSYNFGSRPVSQLPHQVFDFRDHTSIPSVKTGSFAKQANVKIVVPDDLYDTWITTGNWGVFEPYIIKASEYVEE